MDLGRWGFDRFSRITNKYRDMKEFLAEVLEGEHELIDGETRVDREKELAFQVRDDVANARLGAKTRGVAYANLVFQSLVPYFEAGFLLRGRDDLRSMFVFGRTFESSQDHMPVELFLPLMKTNNVYKGRVRPVLKAFGLESLRELHDASALAFSPREGWTFVLICNRPHPWQLGVIEDALNISRSMFANESSRSSTRRGFLGGSAREASR